jgi:CRISPR/Cas system Type II protein with McrA/HNH and RuvC-like nuclease domain
MMKSVLVLNAGYEPLHYVSVTHAINNVIKGKAVIEEYHEDRMFADYPVPIKIRNTRYIKMTWREGVPKWSKKRLFARDNHKCCYCLGEAKTVDHVYPKSMGGQFTWDNTVAACKKCNGKKGNRTPEQAGMKMHYQPFIPTWYDIY